MKKILVCGAGGFIGSHMVKRLKQDGHQVWGVDLKHTQYSKTAADKFVIGDLKDQNLVRSIFKQNFDEVFQFAADMGGAGFIFTGENDASIMTNSALINLNVLDIGQKSFGKIFFSSSACIYPEHNQLDPDNPDCSEATAYPAAPDSDYGWEKLFSERLFQAYQKNFGVKVRIARYHNIFGPEGTWHGGREKAPAAICRKVAATDAGDTIEIWGDGKQTRTFLYIDECIEGSLRLMNSNCSEPLNIGSSELISINDLAKMVMKTAGKHLDIAHISGPNGVRGRSSENSLIKLKLGWEPTAALQTGIEKTYQWVKNQVADSGFNEKIAGFKVRDAG